MLVVIQRRGPPALTMCLVHGDCALVTVGWRVGRVGTSGPEMKLGHTTVKKPTTICLPVDGYPLDLLALGNMDTHTHTKEREIQGVHYVSQVSFISQISSRGNKVTFEPNM